MPPLYFVLIRQWPCHSQLSVRCQEVREDRGRELRFPRRVSMDGRHCQVRRSSSSKSVIMSSIRGNFKERGEQYGTIWDNMEIGATMICLHLKPDWRLSVPRRWTIWGNMKSGATIAPFPFGSLIGQLQNMEQYGAIWKVGQPWFVYIWNQIEGCLCLGILKNKNFILVLL